MIDSRNNFRNPLVVFLFRIHRDIKTSDPVFLTNFDLKSDGLDRPSGKTVQETSTILNRDLEKISLWSTKWKVTFNTDKSSQIIFSKHNFNYSPLLLLNQKSIRKVDTHKHLGLHLTYNLDWSVHIHHTCLKANRKLAVLRQIKLLKRHTLDVLYKLTVRSVVDYALPVYYHSLNVTEKHC